MKNLVLALLLFGMMLGATRPVAAEPPAIQSVSLNGPWKFAADYQDYGDKFAWFSPDYSDQVWDMVQVPHTWSHDPRFIGYIGAGWYRLRFTAPTLAPDAHVRLAFGAVFARARVWLNGHYLGEHEGGYTPFEFDAGPQLKSGAANLLVVRADNRWNDQTLPGARGGLNPQEQVYPWWDDGGIIRNVELLVGPPVYATRQKVEANPDLAAGTATIKVTVWVRNTLAQEQRVTVAAELRREEERLPTAPPPVKQSVPAGGMAKVELACSLSRSQVSLWQLDAPVLYQLRTTIAGRTSDPVTFGIRRFETRGAQLLLNGKPIRLAGANRHASYPGGGQDEPSAVVARDLQLMKEGGLVFQRIAHYPSATAVLDWADRHGLLLIAESGNTGLRAPQMDSPVIRARFQAQHREMIERDWNRPSVIAWSVGNEFAAATPSGVRWVKDMRAFTQQLDSTRLVTFASNTAAKPNLKSEDEGSHYVDFVSLNTYGSTPQKNAENIDLAHARWPDKPLIVTEYGLRYDFVEDETERVDWFREMLAIIRARPFLSGASIWSFNDYRSRYVGTHAQGWREWGLVDTNRVPRGSYHALRREYSGFVVKQATLENGIVRVRLEARMDFPVFPPAECEVRVQFFDEQNRLLGASAQPLRTQAGLTFAAPQGTGLFRGEIWRGGFRTATFGHVRSQ